MPGTRFTIDLQIAGENKGRLFQASREQEIPFSDPKPFRLRWISPVDQGSRGF
jgi:hypothetical protein